MAIAIIEPSDFSETMRAKASKYNFTKYDTTATVIQLVKTIIDQPDLCLGKSRRLNFDHPESVDRD